MSGEGCQAEKNNIDTDSESPLEWLFISIYAWLQAASSIFGDGKLVS